MAENLQVEEPKVEVPEIEQRATSMGWRPKTDWQGNEDDFIDAKEFVRRKPLFDKIESTTKRLKNVEETLTNLASHHQKVKEVEYQNALKTLRLEKREAMKEGDTVKALEYEDKMDELSEAHQLEVAEIKQQAPQQAPGPTPEFTTWVKGNEWYLNEEEMHDAADGAAAAFIARAKVKGTPISETDVFSHVERIIRKTYPEKFSNPNRERPGFVNQGDRSGTVSKSRYTPTEEERQVAHSFVKQGVFDTVEDYYKERKLIKENE